MTAFMVLEEHLGTGNSAGRLSRSLPLEWFEWNMKTHRLNSMVCLFSWIGAVRLLSPWSAGEKRRGWKQQGRRMKGWFLNFFSCHCSELKRCFEKFLAGTLRHGYTCCWKGTARQIIWAEFNLINNPVKRGTGKKMVGEAMSLETSGMFDLQYLSWAGCTELCLILQAKQFWPCPELNGRWKRNSRYCWHMPRSPGREN